MGDLKHKIQEDLNQAIKKSEEPTRSTLRVLLAAILNKEKEKRYKISKEQKEAVEKELVEKSVLTDDEIIEVVASETKKRKEAILLVRRSLGEGGEKEKKEDFINKEQQELEILQKYLPEQISEEELKKLVKEAIDKVGAKEIRDMGKVMAELMPKIKGRADGSLVSKIVKELLS